jgi:hypothetical protein
MKREKTVHAMTKSKQKTTITPAGNIVGVVCVFGCGAKGRKKLETRRAAEERTKSKRSERAVFCLICQL